MLDPKIIRDKPELIKQMLKDRAVEFDFEKMLELNKTRKEMMMQSDELKQKRNQMSVKIGNEKKAGNDASELLKEMGDISKKLDELESDRKTVDENYHNLSFSIPNLIHDSVPKGADESFNKEVRTWGEIPKFDFDVKDHIDLGLELDIVDLERASKTAGARFYYLKDGLVKLGQSLTAFALDFVSSKNYNLIQPPYMINRQSMEGAVIADDFEDVIYKVQDEDLFLIGTSEHAIASMYYDEILEGSKIPLRYASISPCFRKEAGAHGKDQKGIFRVHQFEKIEQFIFCRPEESWEEHEKMIKSTEEFYQQLEIPYRLMLLSSGDMGKVSAKTYDIEAWMAGQNAYREIVSCSNCIDYQSRRLKIRFREKSNEDTKYIHTLNSTLVAIERTMVAILENNQTKDGHVEIPKVLQKYFGDNMI
ncbi:MAG: serine--tRNA ligase [Thermoproteota archaeon]|jgi:seryl-tRNA synthetase|nr:serine--tRNA ligase [Thermoproteota archaeon]MEC8529279.1 serine--tRNA ligase [Thermoproteota archaeon]MEC9033248.1 serine--tRNA ligase [Thermoproteota archaeon]MEC9063530.1 serine--tRNA ligase [Thermoproteota archaeon]MEC9073754.1 serine--tRNA ligase [Thermoproteota archaeon]|tara:strand:- start:1207 stop:2469 length:1263 start_codon:yes stop_codon:yes gene_type:complete